MSKSALSHFIVTALISFGLWAVMGCGVASTPVTTPTPAPVTPVSGTEFFYGIGNESSTLIGDTFQIFVSTLDPGSGTLSTPTSADPGATTLDVTVPNLQLQPGLLFTPSTKLAYLVGKSAEGTGIFGFGQTGSLGLLSPIATDAPFPIVAPLLQITGNVMDGKGRFLYISDAAYGGSTGQEANRISEYTIHAADGSLQTGPVFNETVASELYLMAADPAGKFVFAYREPGVGAAVFSVDVFSIDRGTGALTEVPGGPYPLLAASGVEVLPENVFLNAAGNLLYVAANLLTTVASTQSTTGAVYVYSVNATTGALTAATGSPYLLNAA